MKTKFLTIMLFSAFILASCGGNTDAVDSGTYVGTIKEVVPAKTEIYVNIDDDKTLELYFTEQTTVTRNGNTVDFSALSVDQKVEVEVEKVGKRLDPISVKILE